MKHYLILPALLLASAAHAQTNVLKVDIFQPLINTAALSFEHALSESSSFQIGLSGTFGYNEDYTNFGYFNDERKTSGFAITPEYRFYLSEKHIAPQGFYVAPYARYQYLSQTGSQYSSYDPNTGMPTGYQKYEASLNAFGAGVIVGRHWVFKRKFSLDLFIGPGYTFTSTSSNSEFYEPSKGDFIGYFNSSNNYDFRSGATFGIAF